MFASLLLAVFCFAFPEGWSPQVGGEFQIGRSTRGAAGFEDLVSSQHAIQGDGTGSPGGYSTSYGVVEKDVHVHASVERPLAGSWSWSGSMSLGYSMAVGEAEIEEGRGSGDGYRWEIAAFMGGIGIGARRSFGEHWSFRSDVAVEHGFFGDAVLYSLLDDEKIGDGDVGESGTISEDLELAWKIRLKLGPEIRWNRVVVFPWLAIGSTPVMTENSTIAGVACEGDSDFRNGSIGMKVGWLL